MNGVFLLLGDSMNQAVALGRSWRIVEPWIDGLRSFVQSVTGNRGRRTAGFASRVAPAFGTPLIPGAFARTVGRSTTGRSAWIAMSVLRIRSGITTSAAIRSGRRSPTPGRPRRGEPSRCVAAGGSCLGTSGKCGLGTPRVALVPAGNLHPELPRDAVPEVFGIERAMAVGFADFKAHSHHRVHLAARATGDRRDRRSGKCGEAAAAALVGPDVDGLENAVDLGVDRERLRRGGGGGDGLP